VAIIVVEVSEWRKVNGTMQVIGKTRRDMQVIVISCPNNKAPNINPPYAVKTCVGQQVCINVQTDDDDMGDSVYISLNGGIPGANFTTTNGQETFAKGTLCWTPQPGDETSSPHTFSIEARDNKCPVPSRTIRAFSIFVKHEDSVLDATLSMDTGHCGLMFFDHTPAGNYGSYSSRYSVYNSSGAVIWTSTKAADSAHFTPGKYKVHLAQGAPNYCSNTIIDSFEVAAETISNLRHVRVCEGEELILIPDSSIVADQNYWWYEESTSGSWVSTGKYPYKKFRPTHSGGYSSFLKYKACTIVDTTWISYNLNPEAKVYSDHDSVCMDEPIFEFESIDSLSPIKIAQHYWSFGDGLFDSIGQVSHTFSRIYSFIVNWLVGMDSGCWDAIT